MFAVVATRRGTLIMLTVIAAGRRTWIVLTVIPVGVFVVSLMIPVRTMIPIRMVRTPLGVALFRMAITVTEVRMVGRVVIAILVAVGVTKARNEQEQSGHC